MLGFAFQLLEGVFAVFCFMPTCLWLSAHPFQLAAIEVVCALYLSQRAVDALFAFLEVVGVVAVVGVDRLVVKLHDGVANTFKEEAVVCNHKESSATA